MPQLFRFIDSDLVTAAEHYVKYGLHPGSCCVQILLGDLAGAANACHPVALPYIHTTYETIRAMVPLEAMDSMEAIERWIERGGYQYENTED